MHRSTELRDLASPALAELVLVPKEGNQLANIVFDLLQSPCLAAFHAIELHTPGKKGVRPMMPILRHRSVTGGPASACSKIPIT